MRFLLDTSVISELRKRDRAHPNVARWVGRTPVADIGTSVLVLAEIRRGIELKRRTHPDAAKALDRWFAQMRKGLADRVLLIDEPITEAWALMSISHSLPLIDGLLAATAKVHGLMLVTPNIEDITETGVAAFDPFSE
jgi:predicted nucleic acid-binding protein